MKKISLFKKMTLGLALVFGALFVTSCQSGNQANARILFEQSTCSIIEINGERNLRVTMAIDNQTIFNINKMDVCYDLTHQDGTSETTPIYHIEDYSPFVIRHGISGFIMSEIKAEDQEKAKDIVKVNLNQTKTKITGFQNVWETYMPWWIVAFVLIGISTIGYGVTIFTRGLSTDDLKKLLSEHASSTLVTMLLMLVICIIPLIFSSWVVTLILLGGFLVNILLAYLLTLIRTKMITSKNTNNIQQ